jgi:hypothetical protein
VTIKNASGMVVNPSAYFLNMARGSIRGRIPGSLPAGTYTATYEYYPVYRSPNIQGSPYQSENAESDIFDGLQLAFSNRWSVRDTNVTWVGKNAYLISVGPTDLPLLDPPLKGYSRPADYEIRFANGIVDTSFPGPFPFDVATPVNFRIFNLSDSNYIKFHFLKSLSKGPNTLGPQDELIFLEKDPRGATRPTWDLIPNAKQTDPGDTVYPLGTGDKLVIHTTKPFRSGDEFTFRTEVATVDTLKAEGALDQIRVVPNPYVTASAFEPPLNPGITSGRGERKIDFTHLPANASIKIFTARGDHIRTLQQEGNLQNGTVSWDLKTKENLDIAFGIYFYVVESPVGTKTGKIAIIK